MNYISEMFELKVEMSKVKGLQSERQVFGLIFILNMLQSQLESQKRNWSKKIKKTYRMIFVFRQTVFDF